MLLRALLPIDSERALRVPQVYLFVLWPTSTDGRAAPHSCVPFLLAVGGDKCVLCAALRLCLHSCIVSRLTAHAACAAVACVLVLCVIVPSESTLAARAA